MAMATKSTPTSGQTDGFVMVSFGWYGKFAMPVDAAASIIQTVVKSGAIKIDTVNIDGLPGSFLVPCTMEYDIQPLSGKFLNDCPVVEAKRKEYFAWLTTKASIIEGYTPESYAEYLNQKDES